MLQGILILTGRQVETKFDLYRRSINRIKQGSLCCHSSNFFYKSYFPRCAQKPNVTFETFIILELFPIKDVRVHAPITCIKLGIPIYFIDHSEFITVQCKKIPSRANNEIKCFEFSSIKRALRPHLRTILAI